MAGNCDSPADTEDNILVMMPTGVPGPGRALQPTDKKTISLPQRYTAKAGKDGRLVVLAPGWKKGEGYDGKTIPVPPNYTSNGRAVAVPPKLHLTAIDDCDRLHAWQPSIQRYWEAKVFGRGLIVKGTSSVREKANGQYLEVPERYSARFDWRTESPRVC